MHKLIIHNLGPIDECELTCRPFMTLTGEQASGKSTIAKALYYFRTVKDDVFDAVQEVLISYQMKKVQPGSQTLIKKVREILRRKFLQTFGYQVRQFHQGMRVKYYYTKESHITLRLIIAKQPDGKNSFILNAEPSQKLRDFINEQEDYIASDGFNVTKSWQVMFNAALDKIFNDHYDTIYIPSGRSMLTVMSNYMRPFSLQENISLDYCTQKYIENLSAVKPEITGGLEGLTDYYGTGSNLPASWLKAQELIGKIIYGSYKIDNGEERIILDNGDYVRINFASSGQQDAVWITNLLFYYLVRKRPAFFIIEEPESHLFPPSQKYIMELISLVCNQGNFMLITTHSPYVLGTLNNLLYASSFRKSAEQKEAAKIIPQSLWLDYDKFMAWFVKGGKIEDSTDHDMKMIDNGRIDEISGVINSEYDRLFELENCNAAE